LDKTAVLSSRRRLIVKIHGNCNVTLREVSQSDMLCSETLNYQFNHMLTEKDLTLFKGATSQLPTLKSSA